MNHIDITDGSIYSKPKIFDEIIKEKTKKNLNKGFVLVETLIVTTFVAGVLVYLFIQFSNLSQNYEESYKYNTVENLYSLRNIRNFIVKDVDALASIEGLISNGDIVEITSCQYFTEKQYCLKLFELENIKRVFITTNKFNKDLFSNYKELGSSYNRSIDSTEIQKFNEQIDKILEKAYKIVEKLFYTYQQIESIKMFVPSFG